jgi:hypothetical protein
MTSDRGRRHGEPVWAAFEAEAIPHLDRLFRLAMWFERDRDEEFTYKEIAAALSLRVGTVMSRLHRGRC